MEPRKEGRKERRERRREGGRIWNFNFQLARTHFS